MQPGVTVRFSPTSLSGQGGLSPGGPNPGVRAPGTPGPAASQSVRTASAPSITASSAGTASAGSSPSPTIAPSSPSLPPQAHPSPASSSSVDAQPASSKIKSFAQSMGVGHHQESWKRPTNLTGTGATHVRSFHCRLTSEALEYLDTQVNQWLDQHPDYEVKFVTTNVGEWSGKLKEPNLVVQIWV